MSNRRLELETCVCSGRSLDRMLRPAVLTILFDQPRGLHGYAIEKQLQAFSFFRQHRPDYTGLYRLLKRMDEEGLLSSVRSDSSAGPSKRVYRLTARGRKCMARWLDSLSEYRQMLDDLLARAQTALEAQT